MRSMYIRFHNHSIHNSQFLLNCLNGVADIFRESITTFKEDFFKNSVFRLNCSGEIEKKTKNHRNSEISTKQMDSWT